MIRPESAGSSRTVSRGSVGSYPELSSEEKAYGLKLQQKLYQAKGSQPWSVFCFMDVNRDGKITEDDLLLGSKRLGFREGRDSVAALLRVADKTGKGYLNYNEFIDAFAPETKNNPIQQSRPPPAKSTTRLETPMATRQDPVSKAESDFLLKYVREKLDIKNESIAKVFKMLDHSNKGFVTPTDVQRWLGSINCAPSLEVAESVFPEPEPGETESRLDFSKFCHQFLIPNKTAAYHPYKVSDGPPGHMLSASIVKGRPQSAPPRRSAPRDVMTTAQQRDWLEHHLRRKMTNHRRGTRTHFLKFDTDGDGLITRQEAIDRLNELELGGSDDMINAFVNGLDDNNDGLISYAEFARHLCQDPAPAGVKKGSPLQQKSFSRLQLDYLESNLRLEGRSEEPAPNSVRTRTTNRLYKNVPGAIHRTIQPPSKNTRTNVMSTDEPPQNSEADDREIERNLEATGGTLTWADEAAERWADEDAEVRRGNAGRDTSDPLNQRVIISSPSLNIGTRSQSAITGAMLPNAAGHGSKGTMNPMLKQVTSKIRQNIQQKHKDIRSMFRNASSRNASRTAGLSATEFVSWMRQVDTTANVRSLQELAAHMGDENGTVDFNSFVHVFSDLSTLDDSILVGCSDRHKPRPRSAMSSREWSKLTAPALSVGTPGTGTLQPAWPGESLSSPIKAAVGSPGFADDRTRLQSHNQRVASGQTPAPKSSTASPSKVLRLEQANSRIRNYADVQQERAERQENQATNRHRAHAAMNHPQAVYNQFEYP